MITKSRQPPAKATTFPVSLPRSPVAAVDSQEQHENQESTRLEATAQIARTPCKQQEEDEDEEDAVKIEEVDMPDVVSCHSPCFALDWSRQAWKFEMRFPQHLVMSAGTLVPPPRRKLPRNFKTRPV